MSRVFLTATLVAATLLSGCASPPMGPTAIVMPASGKPFEAFAQDQTMCKQFADGQVDNGADMSNLRQIGTVAVSTLLGGGLGAALRGAHGAEIGSAMGAITGAAMGGRGSAHDQNGLQNRYNLAYSQCMYARGNQVPGMARAGQKVAAGVPDGSPRSSSANFAATGSR
jgi:hypothetical protein